MHGDGVGYTTSPYYFYCLLSQLIQIFTSETKFCVRNLEFVQTGRDQTCKMWASDLSCVGMATAGASDWCLKWTLDVFNQEVGLSHRSQESVLFSLDTFCIYTECCCCSHLLPFQTSCLLNIFPGCIFSAADVVRRDWCVRPHRVCGLQWSWPLGCRYNAGLLLIALTAAVLQ